MVAWFKHDIPAWMDGTESLDAEPYRAYHVICQLIYMNEGPIALNEHGIAGRCKQSIRLFRSSLKILIDSGKLTLVDGRLSNSRVEKELENVLKNRENAGKGGEESGKSRNSHDKTLNNNDEVEASLQDNRSHKTREEETREENITHLPVRDDWPFNYRDLFWASYPHKVGKADALAKLDRARKRGVSWKKIITSLAAYVQSKPPDRPWCNPATWINQGRWDDEPQNFSPQRRVVDV